MTDFSTLQRLWDELKRRRVVRVALVYVVAAWVAVQVAATVFPLLRLPEWSGTLVAALLLLGFPIAVLLAWAFEVTPQGIQRDRRAVPDDVTPGASGRRGALLLLLTAVALAALGGAGWVLWSRRSPPLSEASRSTIAVLPFSVRGSAQFGYLGQGLVDLLSTKLDGAGELRTVDARAVMGVVRQQGDIEPDLENGRAIAAKLGAGLYILGEVVEAAGMLHIEATLYDPSCSGRRLADAVAEGRADDVFTLVDDLAAQLVAGRSGGPGSRVTRVAALTTQSLPALKAYLEGEEHFRAGRYAPALDAFRSAIAQDSTFALAYYRWSIAAEWSGNVDMARAAEAAQRLSSRLSERDRRLVEALLASRRGAAGEAERLYRAIVGSHPDEVEAWFQLGEVLNHYGPLRGRSILHSREPFERVLFYEPEHVASLWHLARVASIENKLEEMDSLVERVRRLTPEGDRTLELVALRAFRRKDAAAQEQVIRDLGGAIDLTRFLAVWNVAAYALDPGGALRVASVLTDASRSAPVRATGYVLAAHQHLALGQLKAARVQLERIREFNPAAAVEYGALFAVLPIAGTPPAELSAVREAVRTWAPDVAPPSGISSLFFDVATDIQPTIKLFLWGLLDAQLGATDLALEHADALERSSALAEFGATAEDMARTVRAQALAQRGDTAAALRDLENLRLEILYSYAMQSPFATQLYGRWLLATLLEGAGRTDEALQWYRSFSEHSSYDIALEAPALLRRARIYEGRGETAQAREHYAAFVQLWKDCDPELRPMVDNAEQRLAALTATGG